MVERIDEQELPAAVREREIDKLYKEFKEVKKAATPNEGEGEHWVWTSIAPEHGFILTDVIGRRTREECRQSVNQTFDKIELGDNNILVVTDGLDCYTTAIKERFATEVKSRRYVRKAKNKTATGRKMELIPDEVEMPGNINYAQVVKRRDIRGHIKEVEQRIVFGTEAGIRAILNQTEGPLKFDTNTIERKNLSRRTQVGKLQRKTIRYAKDKEGLKYQIALNRLYTNFCWTPVTLREKLDKPEINPATGRKRKYLYKTPAMSIGIAKHIWSLKELMMYRDNART